MKIRNIKLNLIIFVGLLILSFALFTMAQENSNTDNNIFLDSDQDGLSNVEEKMYGTDPYNPDTDGDGYTDGAEVKSGYDPTKPAPGDKIVISNQQTTQNTSDSQASQSTSRTTTDAMKDTATDTSAGEPNLTQEVSSKIVSLVTDSSQEQQDITLEDLDSLIQSTTPESLTFDELPQINEKEIIIKKQNYESLSDADRLAKEKEDALAYLTAVVYIMVNNSPQKISEPADLNNFSQNIIGEINKLSMNFSDTSYFENLAEKGSESLAQLKEVEVPESLKDIHIKGLQLLTYATSLKDTAKLTPADPVSNIENLAKVQNLISLSIVFSNEINSRLLGFGISGLPINI